MQVQSMDRLEKLRDAAAANASWNLYDAEQELRPDRRPALSAEEFYSAQDRVRAARTLRALVLWELRREMRDTAHRPQLLQCVNADRKAVPQRAERSDWAGEARW
jgi:hypothetical protein